VRSSDEDAALEEWFLRVLEHFHVYAEEDGERCYRMNPDGTRSPEFPSLDRGDTVLTFDRHTALVREDFAFATRDHPLLGDAMELLLASQSGNASFALLDDSSKPRLWLESIHVLEPVASPRLHADRFLAPAPVRVIVDQHLTEPADGDDPAEADLEDGRGAWLAENRASLAAPIERMSARAEEIAEARAASLRERAREAMRRELDGEIDRLRTLAAVNPNVRPAEIDALESERDALDQALATARLRADSLRLIWQGPTRDGAPMVSKR
jgi:ATP-dependent helicase HepA